MSIPPVQYATAPDGVRLAYMVAGEGPSYVFSRGWVSHPEIWWTDPIGRQFFSNLAAHFRVVLYDGR
jgi:hypothetical protein